MLIIEFCNDDPVSVNFLRVLNYSLVILVNINLDMVLVIQPILCVHAELKFKPLNIFFCVLVFAVTKD